MQIKQNHALIALSLSKLFRLSLLLLLVLIVSSCSGLPFDPNRTFDLSDYRVYRLSTVATRVTGIACAKRRAQAHLAAVSKAKFNLRKVEGNGRYKISYPKKRNFKQNGLLCVEVTAQATKLDNLPR